MTASKVITPTSLDQLRNAVRTKDSVQGLTHNYYRYPARFSPKFVREVIEIFSKPGDVILDPFAGGGTTLVEALATNRHSIGFDVNPIAAFVTQAKTKLLSESEIDGISRWAYLVLQKRIVGHHSPVTHYDENGYLVNLPWTIRRSVEIVLDDISLLKTSGQRRFAKCVLLRTAQWAVDCRKTIPTTEHFRDKFSDYLAHFAKGNRELASVIKKRSKSGLPALCFCIHGSSEMISDCNEMNLLPAQPKLVITSPPYVGVHVLYHQWQVKGRQRTRAPFWIINSLDGLGSAYYTFGHHQSHAKKTYFETAERVFGTLLDALHDDGVIVQLVGFSDHRRYLPRYLQMMNEAGYEEISTKVDALDRARRIWRNVPNRKWYNATRGETSFSKEVLLIHRKK